MNDSVLPNTHMQMETHKLLSILAIKAPCYMLIKFFWTSAIDSSRNVHYLLNKVLRINRIEQKKSLSEFYGLMQDVNKL